MRPARKARGGRIPGVCNRRATPRPGMQRRPNVTGLRRRDTSARRRSPVCSRVLPACERCVASIPHSHVTGPLGGSRICPAARTLACSGRDEFAPTLTSVNSELPTANSQTVGSRLGEMARRIAHSIRLSRIRSSGVFWELEIGRGELTRFIRVAPRLLFGCVYPESRLNCRVS
jgi:hypothetical protein